MLPSVKRPCPALLNRQKTSYIHLTGMLGGRKNWAAIRVNLDMMSIDRRVIESIKAGADNHYDLGISIICPAIEATAKKKLQVSKIGRKEYIQFIRDSYDLMAPFIGAGVDYNATKFSHLRIQDDRQRPIPNPDLADVIYYIFRCGTAHGDAPNPLFELTPNTTPGSVSWEMNFEKGSLKLPQQLLWGLIAAVIFCKANSDIDTISGCWLLLTRGIQNPPIQYRFDVDVFWGAEETVRNLFRKMDVIKITYKDLDK